MHSDRFFPDKDSEGITRYLEASTAVHKTMHSSLYRHRMLPLVAPSTGVSEVPWVDQWLSLRDSMGIKMPPEHAVMPAPGSDGMATRRPLSATEAGAWLRKLLYGSKDQLSNKRISAHSMKATTVLCSEVWT